MFEARGGECGTHEQGSKARGGECGTHEQGSKARGGEGYARTGNVKIEVVRASVEHIAPIARDMRAADRREVWASSRATPEEALEYSLSKSSWAWVWLIDGEPVAMMGVGDVNILAGVGAPWLLGTQKAVENGRYFLRQSKAGIAALRAHYRLLSNYVDGRNKVSIRFLEWLGFEMRESVMMNGQEFYRFEMRGD